MTENTFNDKEKQFNDLWDGITPKGVNRNKSLKFRQYILEHVRQMKKPLNREKKEIMSDLLESVKTSKLEESFNKYLPSVLDGEAPRAKKALSESITSEHTGNKATVITEADDKSADDVVEIDMIRKLAGLSIN